MAKNKIRYKYKCLPTNRNLTCRDLATNHYNTYHYNTFNNSYILDVRTLKDAIVEYNPDEALSRFQLALMPFSTTYMKYNYKCCKYT